MLIDRILLKGIFTLVVMELFLTFAESQEGHDSLPVRIMFYNVENFFDVTDDPQTEDNDFLPSGLMRWTRARYEQKINSVFKTIVAAGEWDPPAIVGFCEVENRKVLEDLVHGTILSNYEYGIIHEESPDTRGIDVCLIFRKDIVHVIDYGSWIPRNLTKSGFHSRSVLYSKLAVPGDTFHLIVNHWPSRRGGVLAGESLRREMALMIRNAVDSLDNFSSGSSKIIIMGDFNCSPDDPVLQLLLKPADKNSPRLINLADRPEFKTSGTYRYLGIWELLDQVIVTENLVNCSGGLCIGIGDFRIFKADFLLMKDSKYPGLTTFSTYRGYRYQGGFSDHLPVLLDLGIR
jgi:hypothetical protein